MTRGTLGLLAWLPALSAASNAGLAVGDKLPPLQGEFLSGRKAVLPEASSGRVALLLIGFTYESRVAVEAWTGKFRAEFGARPDVTFYEIPMIGGLARLGKWFIDSGMRRGTPKADHENVITVYGDNEPWKRRLGFRDPNAAFLVLLDQQGRVAWLHAGGFDEEQYRALSSEARRLLAVD